MCRTFFFSWNKCFPAKIDFFLAKINGSAESSSSCKIKTLKQNKSIFATTCHRHSMSTRTCRRCSHSRRESRAWSVDTRAPGTFPQAGSPWRGPTPWRWGSPWSSCTARCGWTSRQICWRWFPRRSCGWSDLQVPQTLKKTKANFSTC